MPANPILVAYHKSDARRPALRVFLQAGSWRFEWADGFSASILDGYQRFALRSGQPGAEAWILLDCAGSNGRMSRLGGDAFHLAFGLRTPLTSNCVLEVVDFELRTHHGGWNHSAGPVIEHILIRTKGQRDYSAYDLLLEERLDAANPQI